MSIELLKQLTTENSRLITLPLSPISPILHSQFPLTLHEIRFTSFLVYRVYLVGLVSMVCWVNLVYLVGKDPRITGVMPAPTVQIMQPILLPHA